MHGSWKLKYVAPLATAALIVGGGAVGFAQQPNQPNQAQKPQNPQQNSQMQKSGQSQSSAQNQPAGQKGSQSQSSAQNQPSGQKAGQSQNSAQNQPSGQNANQGQTSAMNLDRNQIEQVQKALDQKGFNSGRTDGMVGRRTEAALRSFQQRQGLRANGRVDQQTLASLGLNDLKQQPSTSGQGPGSSGQQPPTNNQGSQQNAH